MIVEARVDVSANKEQQCHPPSFSERTIMTLVQNYRSINSNNNSKTI